MIEMKDIEYVKAIYDNGTLTKAATSLNITQPSLSMYIKNMEERYGFAVFKHVGRRLKLTYLGELFLKHGTDILQYRDNLENILLTAIDDSYGRIRVGIPLIRGSYLMPAILPEYEKFYPNVEIQLVEESATILEDRLLKGDCDIIIVNSSNQSDQLDYHHIGQEEILLAVPHGHPAIETAEYSEDSDYPFIDLNEFKNERFIMSTNDFVIGEETNSLFQTLDFHPSKVIETENIQTALNLTVESYGVSLIYENQYRHLVDDYAHKTELFSVAKPALKSEVIIAYRKNLPLPEYFKEFIRIAEEALSADYDA